MEKTTGQKIQLGLFVIIGLLLFIVAIYFIGDKQKMFGKTNHLTAVFSNVNGLQIGNNVRYSGVNVGTVRSIEMINDTIIKVAMIIDKTIFSHIKKNAVAIIGSDGLVGNRIINILPKKGNAAPISEGDEIQSTSKINTNDMLNTLDITNKNAALLTYDLLKITKQINNGKGTIGLLVQDTVMANEIKTTISNLNQTSKTTSKLVNKASQILISLDKKNTAISLLRDTTTTLAIKKTIANLNQLSTKMIPIIQHLDTTILNIKEGKGAINYLSNNPELVQKIDSTMTNLNTASFNLNEDLKALKCNFLFRGYFKKQEKAKEKAQKVKQESTIEMDKKY